MYCPAILEAVTEKSATAVLLAPTGEDAKIEDWRNRKPGTAGCARCAVPGDAAGGHNTISENGLSKHGPDRPTTTIP